MVSGELARAIALIEAGDLAHVESTRRQVLGFCAGHDDALARSCQAAHLTASALVVDPAEGRFVVLHHRKLDRWLQPGGHADGDGDLAAVARRESEEETALAGLVVLPRAVDLDVHRVRPPGEPPHQHLDLRFVVLTEPGAAAAGPPAGNDESHALRWVTPADLADLGADPSLHRLAQRGLAALAAAQATIVR